VSRETNRKLSEVIRGTGTTNKIQNLATKKTIITSVRQEKTANEKAEKGRVKSSGRM
jgi:hypothetical protein